MSDTTKTEDPNRPARIAVAFIAATITFVFGFMLGSAGNETPSPLANPSPTATVTQRVTTTPADCLSALDYADTGFGYSSEAMQAASDFDVAGLRAATAKLKTLAPLYNGAKALCRSNG